MSPVSFETEYYRLLVKDGILFVTYIGGPITIKIAKDLVKDRLKLVDSKDMPVIVNVIDVNSIDRDARDYLSSEAGLQGLKAGAIVTDYSVFTRHLANFFMRISFSKSKMPAKVFSEEKEAIAWLKQFK